MTKNNTLLFQHSWHPGNNNNNTNGRSITTQQILLVVFHNDEYKALGAAAKP